MNQRPNYSTGFRVFIAGITLAAVGALAIAYGAKSFGGVLLVAGLFISIPFRYQSDWRRTWPDDFPVLARLVGREPHPERWTRTPTWWETAPARSRLTRGSLLIVAGVLWFCSAFTPFPLSYGGTPAFAAILGVCVTGLGAQQVRRALRDLQER